MNKKIILILISLFFISGCSKNNKIKENNGYDENSENEVNIVTKNDITVTGTKIVVDGNNKTLKSKIINNKTVKCDGVTINIKDENGDIIKNLYFSMDGVIEKGEIILIDEDYSFEERTPSNFEIVYEKNNDVNKTTDRNNTNKSPDEVLRED